MAGLSEEVINHFEHCLPVQLDHRRRILKETLGRKKQK